MRHLNFNRFVVGVALPIMLAAGLASCERAAVPPSPPGAVQDRTLAETWGMQIQSLRLTAGGRLLDLRIKVLDPAKAAPILDRHEKRLQILEPATQAVTTVPVAETVGALRQTTQRPVAGKTYYALFANPGGFIRKGAVVNITMGDMVAKDLTVE